jgi:hypothetical protein
LEELKPTTMKAINLFLVLLFLSAGLTADAQTGILDRSKNKASNKATNRVDNRVDQKMDQGLDAIEGIFKKKSKKDDSSEESQKDNSAEDFNGESESKEVQESRGGSNPPSGNGMFSGMFEAAKWKDNYTFNLVSKVHMTTTSKKGKVEESDMTMKVGKDCMAMVVEDPEQKEVPPMVLFDYENHSMITLMEDKGEKSGMAMAMNEEQIARITEETLDEEMDDVVITKTGKTKSILGHTSYQYTYKSEDGVGEMWMAEDVKMAMGDIFGVMTMSNKKAKLPENYPQGYLMEMTSTDTDKGDVLHYLVTSLDEDANERISTSDYNVMDPMSMMKSGQN